MEQVRLDKTPKGMNPVCHASQYDKGRMIRFNLVDGLQPWKLDGDETIELEVRKPDNNIVTTAVQNTSSTYIVIVTTEQMTACDGDSKCEVRFKKGEVDIGSINFILRVEEDPLKNGIESETEIHNLSTQIQEINAEMVPQMVAEEVASQYDSENVVFDITPTAGHGIGYAVTSEGVKNALDEKPDDLSDLGDVEISSPTSNQALVYDPVTGKWVNGEVSTVGSIDDLDDVDTTGKTEGDNLRYDATAQEWKAKPNTVTMTLAEWNAMSTAEQTAWLNDHKKTRLVISDAPNLEYTSEDISYDGSTTTVKEVVDKAIKTDELIVINSQQTTNADGNIDSNVFVSGGYSDSNYAVLSAVVVDNNNACVLLGNYNGRFVFAIKSRNDLSKIANTSVTIRIVLCKTPYLTA